MYKEDIQRSASMKIFNCFKLSKQLIEETAFVKVYKLLYNDKEYKIIVTKKIANKGTLLRFIDDTVYWQQIHRLPIFLFYGDKTPVYKFDVDYTGKISNTFFVVKGAPLGEEGLDSGIFRSPKKYDENFVNVMTYKRFKNL